MVECLRILQYIDLTDKLDIYYEKKVLEFKRSLLFFQTYQNLPPMNPTNDIKISSVEGYCPHGQTSGCTLLTDTPGHHSNPGLGESTPP